MANLKANVVKLLKDKRGAGISPFIKGLMWVTVFTFFIFMFAFTFLSANVPQSELLTTGGNNSILNSIQRVNSSMQSFVTMSNDIKSQMNNAQPNAIQFVFLIFEGAFNIVKGTLSTIGASISVLANVLFPGFGGAASVAVQVIIGAVMAGLLITAVFLIIKNIRTGESDR